MTKVKIVSINDAQAVCDYSGIRGEVTDLNRILNNIDEAEGRNDRLREYIYALRDLQRAYNISAFENNDADIHKARRAVREAFDRLILAEFTLNRTEVTVAQIIEEGRKS
jgi:hypothetical protein